MAITLQRKLELAGALSKVQPQLIRLHLLRKAKRRHRLRNGVLIGGTVAACAVVAVAVLRRRACRNDAKDWNGGDTEASSPTQRAPDIRPDSEGLTTNAAGPQDVGAFGTT
jgi:hypothetical protein